MSLADLPIPERPAALRALLKCRRAEGAAGPRTARELARALGVTPSLLGFYARGVRPLLTESEAAAAPPQGFAGGRRATPRVTVESVERALAASSASSQPPIHLPREA